jgi:hypothetical protein
MHLLRRVGGRGGARLEGAVGSKRERAPRSRCPRAPPGTVRFTGRWCPRAGDLRLPHAPEPVPVWCRFSRASGGIPSHTVHNPRQLFRVVARSVGVLGRALNRGSQVRSLRGPCGEASGQAGPHESPPGRRPCREAHGAAAATVASVLAWGSSMPSLLQHSGRRVRTGLQAVAC